MAENKSRLTLARAAIRPRMHGRLLLAGPPGAGKTYSALTIAEVLAGPDGKILVIDTEKESAQTYADLFQFDHLKWAAPFDPRALAATIMDAGHSYDVVMIDSFSHFWRKKGGTLDIAGGKFTGWQDARPAQEDITEAILEVDAHAIVCCRSKMDHVQETGADGKIRVTKLGMATQQDDDFEYEVNISIELDMQHVLQVGKSRTNAVPVGTTFTAGHADEFAATYRDWLEGGEPIADRGDVDALIASLNAIPDRGAKVEAKNEFLAVFGRPEFLLVSRLPDAQEWVDAKVAPPPVAPTAPPQANPAEDAALRAEVHEMLWTRVLALPAASIEAVSEWCKANGVTFTDTELDPTPPTPELLDVISAAEAAALPESGTVKGSEAKSKAGASA